MIHTESLSRAPAREERRLSNSVPADQLRAMVERIERVEDEIRGLNDDKRDIYAEAKGNGYCVKTLKKVVAIRRQDAAARQEAEAILETYLAALGLL